jgi:hypothetical protein
MSTTTAITNTTASSIEEGLDFILSHFKPPYFPRMISTYLTAMIRPWQVLVYSREEALARFKQSNRLDCRISAYPYPVPVTRDGVNMQTTDFFLSDLDRKDFKTNKSFDEAMGQTLQNFKDRLHGANPSVTWSGGVTLSNNRGEIVAAKVIIYAEEADEYFTFITPEAYSALKDWIDFRTSYGEKITGDSWLMRDLWQTTNQNYGARWGLATNPKRLQSIAIKRLLSRTLWEQGIRQALAPGVKRHEWKGAHGYRKAFKSRAEQVMRPANVEILMGYDIGVSESYWRPTEQELLDDYLKAVPLLTILGNGMVLLSMG